MGQNRRLNSRIAFTNLLSTLFYSTCIRALPLKQLLQLERTCTFACKGISIIALSILAPVARRAEIISKAKKKNSPVNFFLKD